jgi:hypothetical protein
VLIPVQFIDQFRNGSLSFCICIVLVDALFVRLFDGDHGIPGEILKFRENFLRHLADTVFNKAGIFVRGKNHGTFVAALEEFVDPCTHGMLQNQDDLFEIDMLVIIRFDTEKPLASLVMGCHRNFGKERIDLVLCHTEIRKHVARPIFHNILSTRAGRHSGYFCADTLSDDWFPERTPGNCACMYLDHFMACGMADRGFAFYHEFTAHEYFCTICIFMPVKQLTRNHTAEFFDLVDIPIYCLLKNFINYFEVPGEVCTFEAPGQIDVYIEIGNENNRSFLVPVYLNKFFYIFNPDSGKVDADIRRSSLNIRQLPVECFILFLIGVCVFNRSSHPDGFLVCFFSFFI